MANVQEVGLGKDGPTGEEGVPLIAKYENNLGVCPSPDDRYVGVSNEQVMSVTKTQYFGCQTASLNNYYNHDDVRAVHLDKAPWNDYFFMMSILGTVGTAYGFSDGFASEDETSKKGYEPREVNTYIGIVFLVFFLIYFAKLLYQYFRPKVFASVQTARMGNLPCGWSSESEALVFIGKGDNLDILSKDDIGHGILALMQQEPITGRDKGLVIKGEETEIILTNSRVSIRRSKRCCCGKIVRQDQMSSYKLEEIASATADNSFPLWWILATIYALGLIIGYVVECDEANKTSDPIGVCYQTGQKGEDWKLAIYIMVS
jgi:hypothetical protein